MNSSMKKLMDANIRLSLLFSCPVAILCLIFWPHGWGTKILACIGVFYGAMLALISLWMICRKSGDGQPEIKNPSGYFGNYMGRFAMYAILLFAGAFIHIPVLSMLFGVICSKTALFYYADRHAKETAAAEEKKRKEDEAEELREAMALHKSELDPEEQEVSSVEGQAFGIPAGFEKVIDSQSSAKRAADIQKKKDAAARTETQDLTETVDNPEVIDTVRVEDLFKPSASQKFFSSKGPDEIIDVEISEGPEKDFGQPSEVPDQEPDKGKDR